MNKEILKMKVLLNKDNVVIAKPKNIEKTEYGFYIKEENTYFPLQDFLLVETTLEPEPEKHKLVNGQIVENENYKTLEQIEAEIKALQKLHK
jgi:hypothetical protein